MIRFTSKALTLALIANYCVRVTGTVNPKIYAQAKGMKLKQRYWSRSRRGGGGANDRRLVSKYFLS